ncbi:MAG: glycosyltransferase [Cyclobacteriaceae bacterium]
MPIILICFLGALAVQGIYLTLYWIAFSRKGDVEVAEPQPVSVIVSAHDEEDNLRELIPMLLQQDYPEFEVIVVDDRSNDETFGTLHHYAQTTKNFKHLEVKQKPEHVNGKKFALTLAIKAAAHEWVLLTDADCRPASNHWIKSMSTCFSKDVSLVAGYSPYEKRAGLLNAFIRYESLLTAIQYLSLALMGKPYMGVGRNLAYKKSLFLQNKGYSTHLGVTGGDDDLFVNTVANRLNLKPCLLKESIVYSKPKLTWGDFYLQKVRHLSVGKRYRTIDKLRLGAFNISLILTWLLFVPALLLPEFLAVVLTAFIARIIILFFLSRTVSRKLGDGFEAWKVPFLDFIFAIYYLVTGLVALQTNKIRWKKT